MRRIFPAVFVLTLLLLPPVWSAEREEYLMESRGVQYPGYDGPTRRLQSLLSCDWVGQKTPDLMIARGLTVRLYGEHGTVDLTAPNGTINDATKTVRLSGGVEMHGTEDNPLLLATEYLRWDMPRRRVMTHAPVQVVTRELRMDGSGLRVAFARDPGGRMQLDTMSLLRNVRMRAEPRTDKPLALGPLELSDGDSALQVRCEGPVVLTFPTDSATFRDQVVASYGRMTTHVDTLTFVLSKTDLGTIPGAAKDRPSAEPASKAD